MTNDLQDPGSSYKLDEARFLWDRYRYRHEHCWNLVFKITTAVVAILIIPYIRHDITESVGWLILALPATAVGLLLFSHLRMDRELDVLDKVKKEHRRRRPRFIRVLDMRSTRANSNVT